MITVKVKILFVQNDYLNGLDIEKANIDAT